MKKLMIVGLVMLLLVGIVNADVNDNLLLVLNLDEITGTTAFDTSGIGRDFTNTGASINQVAKNTTFGTAYNLGNDYITRSEEFMDLGTGDFSFCFFFNPTDWTTGEQVILGNNNGANLGFQVLRLATTSIQFTTFTNGVTHTFNGGNPTGNWHQICGIVEDSGTNLTIVEDNYLSQTTNIGSGGSISGGTDLDIGRRGGYDDRPYNGLIDELVIWDKAITVEEISFHFGNQYPESVTPPTPTSPSQKPNVTLIKPANNTVNNSFIYNHTFSVTIENGTINGCGLYTLNTSNDWILRGLTTSPLGGNGTYGISYTYPNEGTYLWNVICERTITFNSSFADNNFTLTIDTIFPLIQLNDNNGFNQNNYSLINQYWDVLPLNITVEDERDLEAFSLNVTNKLTGVSVFYYENITLSGTIFDYINILNTSSWNIGIYNFEISVADSHNALIKPYNVPMDKELYKIEKNNLKELRFETKENNNIRFYTEQDATLKAIRKENKYEIEMNYNTSTLIKIIYLESDNLKFKGSHNWDGHFTIFNPDTWEGNYVDFNNDYDKVKVKKLSDTLYKITLFSLGDKVTFHTIGGLNTRTANYEWYRGNYTSYQTPSDVFSGDDSTITLNISTDDSISSIVPLLYYNGEFQSSPTATAFGDYTLYTNDIPATTVVSDTNFPYYWVVNVTQGDGNLTTFNTTEQNQTIFDWGIDTCETFIYPAFTFNTSDEKTNLPLVTNITFTLLFYRGNDSSNLKGEAINVKNNHSYDLCKSHNQSYTGNIISGITSPDYGDRTYSNNDVLYNGTFEAYLLPIETTSGIVTFNIQDTAGNKIENAEMEIFRIIDGQVTSIFLGTSDFAGQISIYLDQLYSYIFTIDAEGFPFKTFTLQPANPPYTITLVKDGETFIDGLYNGVRYKLKHNGKDGLPTIINVSNIFQNISFTVEGNTVEGVGINLSNHGYECIPANCFDSIGTQGTVQVSIKINESGTFSTAFYFIIDGERIYVNDGLIKGVPFIYSAGQSLVQLMEEIRESTSPNFRVILLAVISIILVSIGTQIGIFGYGLLMPVLFLNIFASLPEIGLVHPLIGMFIGIFSFGLFLWANMRDK